MPLFDRKGPPEGTGPMTGRQRGYRDYLAPKSDNGSVYGRRELPLNRNGGHLPMLGQTAVSRITGATVFAAAVVGLALWGFVSPPRAVRTRR